MMDDVAKNEAKTRKKLHFFWLAIGLPLHLKSKAVPTDHKRVKKIQTQYSVMFCITQTRK